MLSSLQWIYSAQFKESFQWPNILILLLVILLDFSVIIKIVDTLKDVFSLAFSYSFFPLMTSPPLASFSFCSSFNWHFLLFFTFWVYTFSLNDLIYSSDFSCHLIVDDFWISSQLRLFFFKVLIHISNILVDLSDNSLMYIIEMMMIMMMMMA